MIRLVASDLDGTLVRSDGTLSERTVAAVRRVEQAGGAFVFVTGRPPRWMREVALATGHTGLAVCANGALLYDLHGERVVESFPLAAEAALSTIQLLRTAIPEVRFAVEAEAGFALEPGYRARYDLPPDVRVAPVEELVASPVVKLLARSDRRTSDELLALAREVLGESVTATHSTPGTGGALLEISAAGVSKATTLARLCAERGLGAEDVVAFGDMPNDLPMLAWAGTAYAVANAHPDVLAAVRLRTASNDDDGVARVVEQLFA